MAVHPAPGCWHDTLVQRLREHYVSRGQAARRVDPISRLDRGTSGLILLAADPSVHPALHRQVIRHEIHREYSCLVYGRPLFENTEVNVPVGRHWQDFKRMAVYDVPSQDVEKWGARPAVTNLRVVERFDGAALLTASLQTGRMHQIRVHCQFIRHPVIGDPVYGVHRGGNIHLGCPINPEIVQTLQWQCLHAGRLEFRHPVTGDQLILTAPLPPVFARLLEYFRANG